MKYGLYPPPAHLKDVVRYFWIFESDRSDSMPNEYQGMADCSPEIIFQYDGHFIEHRNYDVYLRAPRSESQILHLGEKIGLFGIRLFPHAMNQLVHIPNSDLVNGSFELSHVLGKGYDHVTQQMIEASTDAEKIKVATRFISELMQTADYDPIHHCVRLMLQNEGNVDLDELRAITGLSVKQFERRFKAAAGFPPKYYSRINRFQATKRKYATGQFKTLSELSHACDYYDQSHFIREFKEFSGMQANRFFKLVADSASEESAVLKNLILAKDNLA